MASRHLLLKIIEIQNIVLREKENGRTQAWIYYNLIRDKYFIAKSTYDKYLSINAKNRYKKLEDEENAETKEKA